MTSPTEDKELLTLAAIPEPAFQLRWRDGAYYVSKPGIGETDVFTRDQVEATRRETLEWAAKECERHTTHPDDPFNEVWQCAYNHVAGELAAAIRSARKGREHGNP